jgi:hypothetical protein
VLAELDGVFVADDAVDDAGILLSAAAVVFFNLPGAWLLFPCAAAKLVATRTPHAAAKMRLTVVIAHMAEVFSGLLFGLRHSARGRCGSVVSNHSSRRG